MLSPLFCLSASPIWFGGKPNALEQESKWLTPRSNGSPQSLHTRLLPPNPLSATGGGVGLGVGSKVLGSKGSKVLGSLDSLDFKAAVSSTGGTPVATEEEEDKSKDEDKP
jgi:hypothetical protein